MALRTIVRAKKAFFGCTKLFFNIRFYKQQLLSSFRKLFSFSGLLSPKSNFVYHLYEKLASLTKEIIAEVLQTLCSKNPSPPNNLCSLYVLPYCQHVPATLSVEVNVLKLLTNSSNGRIDGSSQGYICHLTSNWVDES